MAIRKIYGDPLVGKEIEPTKTEGGEYCVLNVSKQPDGHTDDPVYIPLEDLPDFIGQLLVICPSARQQVFDSLKEMMKGGKQ